MKQRNSFVANSSSSSFVVVYRELTNVERHSIFSLGIMPEDINGKVECMTGRYLYEADDVVYIDDTTLPAIIEHGLVPDFEYSAKVVVEHIDEDDFVIKPEHVGCKIERVDQDYCATGSNVERLLMRYPR